MGVRLNEGQLQGAKQIRDWYKSYCEQTIEISGGPGTGKTTMIRAAVEALGLDIYKEVLFVSFMGKAATVMRRNGLNANTIHSTFYQLEKQYVYDENNRPVRLSNGRLKCKITFVKRSWIPNYVRLIVIDEAGTAPDSMIDDILDYDIPVMFVGDKDQLPPVFGSSRLFKKPDIVLTQIMRQAEGSPIIQLAAAIRDGRPIDFGKWGKNCYVEDEYILNKNKIYTKSDIIICGKNKTRELINNHVRYDILGRKNNFPVEGDMMVCRKNNWNLCVDDIPLTNGTYGEIMHVDKSSFNGKSVKVDFRPDFLDDSFDDIPIDLEYLFSDVKSRNNGGYYGNGNLLEYGYAITCQLSQGSQYGKVVIIEEQIGDSDYHRRWLYTAVTRAEYGLVLVRPTPFKKLKKLFK